MPSKQLTTKQFFKLKKDFYVLDIEDESGEAEHVDLSTNANQQPNVHYKSKKILFECLKLCGL